MITADGLQTLQYLHRKFGLNFSELNLPRGQISGFQILASATDLPPLKPYLPKKKFFLPYTGKRVKVEEFQPQLEAIFRNPGRRFDILYHLLDEILPRSKLNEYELMNLLILPLREEQERNPNKEIGTVELLNFISSNPYFGSFLKK